MRILITGSTGNIGKWVVSRLLKDGHELLCIDTTGEPMDSAYEYWPGDVRDMNLVRKAMRGMGAVVHLAAIPFDMPRQDELILDVNIRGTYNILQAAHECGTRRVIYFSSINALGQGEEHHPALYLPLDDDIPHYNVKNYSLTKHLGEEMCKSFALRGSLSTVSLRPTMVLEGNKKNFWEDMLPEEYKIRGSVADFFSYVDVRDVAEAAALAVTADLSGHHELLLAANDLRQRIPTAEVVEKHYGHLPWPKVSKQEWLSQGEYVGLLDCSKARSLLGWEPRYSKFAEE